MTGYERIDRLEQMVKTLAETLDRVLSSVKTGDYEYNLSDLKFELRDVEEFSRPEK